MKHHNPLPTRVDAYYPRFQVYELYFESKELAAVHALKIEAAINSDDIFNEKQYDYLLRNGCALIYVHCNVSLFKEYAFQYRDSLKRLVQQ